MNVSEFYKALLENTHSSNLTIACHILFAELANNKNNDDLGHQKTIDMNGTTRNFQSANSKKRQMRLELFPKTITSSRFSSLIAIYLSEMVANGELDEADVAALQDKFELALCKSPAKKDEKKEDKGNQACTYDRITFLAILDAMKTEVLQNGVPTDNRLLEIAKAVYKSSPMDPCVALFGVMSTHDVVTTVDGAAKMSGAVGINRYAGDTNYWTHAGYRGTPDVTVPEFMKKWQIQEASVPGAENLGYMDMTADVMYQYSSVDVRTFVENMRMHDEYLGETLDVAPLAGYIIPRYFQSFMTQTSATKQHSFASIPAASIAYFELIEDGQPVTMNFEKPIKHDIKNDKSVMEQGIEKIALHARDEALRYAGKITKYVVLSALYEHMEPLFEAAGVTVLHSGEELRKVLADAAEAAAAQL